MSECAICLCSLFDKQFYVFDCGHMLHQECADVLLKVTKSCPICRQTISRLIKPFFDYEKDFPRAELPHSHSMVENKTNFTIQFYKKEIQKYRSTNQDLAVKIDQLTISHSYEQTRCLEARRALCEAEETFLLKTRQHDLIVSQLLSKLENYQATCTRKIDQLTAECESLRGFGTANEICELVEKSLLIHNSEDYLNAKRQNSKELLLQEIAIWMVKGQELQRHNEQLKHENRTLQIELERIKRKEKQKLILESVGEVVVPNLNTNNQPSLFETRKRNSSEENSTQHFVEKKIKIKEGEKNSFFGRTVPNSSRFSNLVGKRSDGRGNFVRITTLSHN